MVVALIFHLLMELLSPERYFFSLWLIRSILEICVIFLCLVSVGVPYYLSQSYMEYLFRNKEQMNEANIMLQD